ncbi:MAG: hypothetical protein V4510_07885 [bacterium]
MQTNRFASNSGHAAPRLRLRLQVAASIAIVLAAVLPPTAVATDADQPRVSFAIPAAAGGHENATAVTRLILWFMADGPDAVTLRAENLGGGTLVNHTMQNVRAMRNGTLGGGWMGPGQDAPRQDPAPWNDLSLDFRRPGSSSLVLVADRIDFRTTGRAAIANSNEGIGPLLPTVIDEPLAVRVPDVPDNETYLVWANGRGEMFTLNATGVRQLEWFNASTECTQRPCPPPGGRTRIAAPSLAGSEVTVDHLSHQEFRTNGGNLTAQGALDFALAGGPAFDVEVDGWVRLPLASASSCAQCDGPHNQTLLASGHVILGGLHSTGPRSAAAGFGGELQDARLDESPAPATLVSGIAVTGEAVLGLAALLVLLRFLAPLLTAPQDPLAHPRRASLHAFICEHPGASFREVCRSVRIPTGTTRHHLNVLKRAGLVIEYQHHSRMRFFENHGRYTETWRHTAVLRDPELANLRSWIEAHPGAPQKDVLNAMETCGWSRSTTQHRLARLQNEGIIAVRFQGRYKTYAIGVERPLLRKAAK